MVWLHAGISSSIAKTVHSISIPAILRFRRSPPIPTNNSDIPGTANQSAYKPRVNEAEAVVVTGRAVVGMLNVAVAPLVLCTVMELEGVKLHVAPVGKPEHERLMADVYNGRGNSDT